jgi:hypothetical protein
MSAPPILEDPSGWVFTRRPSTPGDVGVVRLALIRDFCVDALGPVLNENTACIASLMNADDTGAHYHLTRMVAGVKAAVSAFNELDALKRKLGADEASERAS